MKKIDIIAASKSGTGKTASFALPILHRIALIMKQNNKIPKGLIILPTRELVDQVSLELGLYGKFLKVKHTKIKGGTNKTKQQEKLSMGIDLIVATPGRLKDMIKENIINISTINMIIIDEVDTLLEFGFLKEIEFILSNCSDNRQIMMFSATVSQNIKKLAKEFLRNPIVIEVSQRRDTVNLIKHKAYKIDKLRKNELLYKILTTTYKDLQVLIFLNMKSTVDELLHYLKQKNLDAFAIHGDISYENRVEYIKKFRYKKIKILLATDIISRGLDIKNLPLVINYELPKTTDEFTHRAGRTGRLQNNGLVVSLLTIKDYNHFTKIERHLRLSVKREVHSSFELTDRQPRQKQMIKKSFLNNKKQKENSNKMIKKNKKITKRDSKRVFRKP